MDTKTLFSYGDVKNHPHRSGFDLSQKVAFTAKVGELLPLHAQFMIPGDKHKLKHQHFTRTMPVNTAAFTRIREYFDWYYVPLRLLGKSLIQGYVQMAEQSISAKSLTTALSVVQDSPYCALHDFSSLLYVAAGGNPSVGSAIKNQFGFNVSATSAKLLWYLRYGPLKSYEANSLHFGLCSSLDKENELLTYYDDYNLSVLPLAAYQKIYSDFFRFTQWEKSEPQTYNFDYYSGGNVFDTLNTDTLIYNYMKNNNLLTLRYVNWHKDLYMGLLPSSQLGSVAAINLSQVSYPSVDSSASYRSLFVGSALPSPGSSYSSLGVQSGSDRLPVTTGVIEPPSRTPVTIGATGVYPLLSNIDLAGFNVIQLRIAEATQRWKEISQCADQTYRDQLYAHFGVKLSQSLSDQCQYIGGSAHDIDISEVINNNITGSNSAEIAGKGVGSGSSSDTFIAKEPGVLMCLYHAAPLLDYCQQAPYPQWFATQFTDFPIPELDSIGMESVPFSFLSNNRSVNDASSSLRNYPIGYSSRYIAYKTDIDIVTGAFLSTMPHWVAAITPSSLKAYFNFDSAHLNNLSLNFNFFKVNPGILNSIFVAPVDSSWDTDQLLVNCFFDHKAVRNLDYDGMPY